jgi:hypothetical protein
MLHFDTFKYDYMRFFNILLVLTLILNYSYAQEIDLVESDTTPKLVLSNERAKELHDSILIRFEDVIKQYNIERISGNEVDNISAEDLLRTAVKKYMYLKHVYGLQNKILFSEAVFDKGVIACRQLRSIPMTLMFQKDKTSLYGTNLPHAAFCDGSCGKCPGISNVGNK